MLNRPSSFNRLLEPIPMRHSILGRRLLPLLACILSGPVHAMPAGLVVPARCSMGQCGELAISSKRPIRDDTMGTLYEVKVGYREWPSESPKPSIGILPFQKPSTN